MVDKDKERKRAREYNRKWRAANRERWLESNRKLRANNRERYRELGRAQYHRNPEPVKAYSIEWLRAHPEKVAQWRDKFHSENPQYRSGSERLRTERLQFAQPQWLNEQDKRLIKDLYLERDRRNKQEGHHHKSKEYWTVDHSVPLQGKTVCGLHVPWNLELIRRGANSRKRNKLSSS